MTRISTLIVIISIHMCCFAVQAIQYVERPKYDDLIVNSNLIISGQLISQSTSMRKIVSTRWSKDGPVKYTPTTLITEYTLELKEILKGDNDSKTVKLWAPFGCLNDVCVEQSNDYYLEEGKEYVLFLRASEDNQSEGEMVYWSYGHNLGVFYVEYESGKHKLKNYYFKSELNGSQNLVENKAAKQKQATIDRSTTLHLLKAMINE